MCLCLCAASVMQASISILTSLSESNTSREKWKSIRSMIAEYQDLYMAVQKTKNELVNVKQALKDNRICRWFLQEGKRDARNSYIVAGNPRIRLLTNLKQIYLHYFPRTKRKKKTWSRRCA